MAWWLFQNVVMTAALAAVVALVCRVTPIGPVARHALWVLVLVKFVTPPLLVWPWNAPDPLGVASITFQAPIAINDVDRAAALDAVPPDWHDEPLTIAAPGRLPQTSSAAMSPSELAWLFWLWAAGSLGLAGVEGVRLLRLARRVGAAAPADPAIARRVAELSSRLGLRPVPVVTIEGHGSPAIWCVGRPRLLWPADLTSTASRVSSDDPCIDGVIVHELAHVKRRDHLVGWIELAAGVVWWWNPLFWYVRSSRREQAELACDAWVISALPNGRRAYAESLLALSGAMARATPTRSLALIGIRAASRRALERRLVMIMQGRAPIRLSLAGVLTLALIAGATLPAWATRSQAQVPPPPPPAVPAVKPKPQELPPPPPPAVPAVKPKPQELPPPPPPPPRPVTRSVAGARRQTSSVVQLPTPPPPPLPPVWTRSYRATKPQLPDDGRQLLDAFDADLQVIQKEAEKRIDERTDTLVKALQGLQEQYTKAGKLDDAVAIRNYLQSIEQGAGFPLFGGWIRRK